MMPPALTQHLLQACDYRTGLGPQGIAQAIALVAERTGDRALMDGRHHVAAVICDASDATIDGRAV
jgi:hypothetical protein